MAMHGPHGGEGGGVFADINITPLTDIFLVLLIIFMVTTSVTIDARRSRRFAQRDQHRAGE